MKLVKCRAKRDCVSSGIWHARDDEFVTNLADALRLGSSVERLSTFDEPDPPAPRPPAMGTKTIDAPDGDRMIRRSGKRIHVDFTGKR